MDQVNVYQQNKKGGDGGDGGGGWGGPPANIPTQWLFLQ